MLLLGEKLKLRLRLGGQLVGLDIVGASEGTDLLG